MSEKRRSSGLRSEARPKNVLIRLDSLFIVPTEIRDQTKVLVNVAGHAALPAKSLNAIYAQH